MHTKACLAVLASAALTNGALAVNHRHAQRHHHEKKAIFYETTDVVTETDWVTVTVGGETVTPVSVVPTTTSPSTSTTPTTPSTSVAPTTSSPPVVVPTSTPTPTSAAAPTTTLATSIIPSSAANYDADVVVPTTTSSSSSSTVAPASSSAAAATAAAAADSDSDSGNKRGAAYNTASLISPLTGSGSKISWAYNWGQVSDGLSDVDSSLEFVPMLWSNRADFISTWETNAKSAISNGAKNFLSFNEPDNSGQANMDPATAAAAHIQYMNPYSGSVRLSSPAITNSGTEGEGVSWLKEWVSACNGECDFSFCAAHWYSPVSSSDFLNFVSEVTEACDNKPVWITEFQPLGASDSDIVSFLEEIQDAVDNNSTYSFVERYAYFMVADGNLVSGSSASTFGSTFAYS